MVNGKSLGIGLRVEGKGKVSVVNAFDLKN